MKTICRFIAKLIGWKVVGDINIPQKCVICVAPHTSNWDLMLGLILYTSMGNRASFLIKGSWFFFPMSILFNALGGVPVNRSKKTSLTEQMANIYNSRSQFQLAITPEGTRKPRAEWKRGFYYIALEAQVPIAVVALDYKEKHVDFKKILVPTGDVEAEIKTIKNYYKGVTARHPENFILEL